MGVVLVGTVTTTVPVVGLVVVMTAVLPAKLALKVRMLQAVLVPTITEPLPAKK